MLRNRAVALALTILLSPAALALGLGALKTSSALNEPFDGRIEILGATATDMDTLKVQLADAAQFQHAGVQRDAVLLLLKFEIVESESGPDYIHLTTKDAVREPFLNFLIELNWSTGRAVREYTVLLDPPLYDPNRRAQSRAATPAPALADARKAPVPQNSPRAPAAAPAQQRAAIAPGGSIGPVQATDTLWSLASVHRPDEAVSVQQMMIALLRANPAAFTESNVNMLKRGAVLRVPSAQEIGAVSRAEALQEIKQQHQLWEDYRQGVTKQVPSQPMGAAPAPAISTARATPPRPQSDARLELAAPGGAETPAKTPGGAASGAAASGNELSTEQADTTSQENSELKAKLTEADQIIDLLQSQVKIKDEELAALQKRMAEAGIEHGDLGAPAASATLSAETPAIEAAAPSPGAEEAPVAAATPEAPASEAPPPAAVTPPAAASTPATTEEPKSSETPSFLQGLIPDYISSMVPGGVMTVLGAVAALVLGIVLLIAKGLSGPRDDNVKPAKAPAPVTAREVSTADPTLGFDDEPITETRGGSTTQLPVTSSGESATRFDRTLEATAEQLSAEAVEDPLEEVNVYLAYERFDQAEDLVKKVIEKFPNEHKYKLRLLEIYYSANNKKAYEEAARELRDAVGEADPLWENAVAMWTEMSPDRPLFAAGAVYEAAAAAGVAAAASKAFVDITSNTSPGGAAMSTAPGRDDALESTQVGLGGTSAGDVAGLDFDLGTEQVSGTGAGLLDLTTGEQTSDDGILDLTATTEEMDSGQMLDLTSGDPSNTADFTDVFDISGDLETDTGLEVDTPQSGTVDLLDVTKTGNLSLAGNEDLLNVTSPGFVDRSSATGSNALATAGEPTLAANDNTVEFDISDTVAPAVDGDELQTDADTGELSLTAADDALDFDISGLSADDAAGLDLSLDAGGLESGGLDLDIGGDTASEINLDLSLQNPALDEMDEAFTSEDQPDSESEIEFDLALQDTTDFDNLAIDDTLELPKGIATSEAKSGDAAADESLEDLTRSMEESMAGLDMDEDADNSGTLDFGLESLDDNDEIKLDFGAMDGDDSGLLDTLALDSDELDFDIDSAPAGADKTVIIPRDEAVEVQDDSDEVDTKLNLAKAYMELGDSEGARSILNEVVSEGTPAQQGEAQKLIGQLG